MGMKYTYAQFKKDYPDDDACLEFLFQNQFGGLNFCHKCGAETTFHRVKKRPSYACKWCGYQLYPLAGTIFRKTTTPLTSWFHAIYLFSVSKNGVSAKELERHLGVGYGTALRMTRKIRLLMAQSGKVEMTGIVEVDEMYVGGRRRGSKRGRGVEHKVPVVGVVERGGEIRVEVTKDTKTASIMPLLREFVSVEAQINTDEYRSYLPLKRMGYTKHSQVRHAAKQYVIGEVHTNTIEGFWSHVKRSIHGTYNCVSPKYLHTYLDEFVFRYNFRGLALCPVLLELASKRP